jgi:hypothetical protein
VAVSLLLELLGLACLTAAGWLVAVPLGLLVAGLALVLVVAPAVEAGRGPATGWRGLLPGRQRPGRRRDA